MIITSNGYAFVDECAKEILACNPDYTQSEAQSEAEVVCFETFEEECSTISELLNYYADNLIAVSCDGYYDEIKEISDLFGRYGKYDETLAIKDGQLVLYGYGNGNSYCEHRIMLINNSRYNKLYEMECSDDEDGGISRYCMSAAPVVKAYLSGRISGMLVYGSDRKQ